MKILHLYDEYDRVRLGEGTGPNVVYNLSREMVNLGHDVTVLERQWKGSKKIDFVEGFRFVRKNLHFCSDESRYDPHRPRNLIQSLGGVGKFILDRTELGIKTRLHLLRNEYDAILVYSPFSAVVLATLSPKISKKIVYRELIGELEDRLRIGNNDNISGPFRYMSPDLYLIKKAEQTIFQNEEVRRAVIQNGAISKEHSAAISFGVDTQEFNPELDAPTVRSKYELGTDRVILFSSPMIPRKGFIHLVGAADILVNKMGVSDVSFILKSRFCDEEYLEAVKSRVRSNDLENLITIITDDIPLSELKQLYATCDIYVQSSLQDPCPTSMLEPVACGKPVVGSNIGGIKDVIEHGRNGYLVEPKDEEEFTERIDELLRDPEQRKQMGRNSRIRAVEQFDWQEIAKKHIDVCKRLT